MRLLIFFLLTVSNLYGLAQSVNTTNPDSIKFNVSDIVNFWSAYDRLSQVSTKADSLQIIEQSYLSRASRGLRQFLQMSNSDVNSYLNIIRSHPKILTAMRAKMLAIPTIKNQVLKGAMKLKKAYPASIFPELFFCVSKFEVAGSREKDILYIGSEMTCLSESTPRDEITNSYLKAALVDFASLDAVYLHEIAHYQQQLTLKTNLCENYYRKAKNKEEALRNIITLQKPQVIYQEGGY